MAFIRLALRHLRYAPGFTAATIGMTAVGIGATAVLLAVVNAIFVRSLPYEASERLVTLHGTFNDEGPEGRHSLSYQELKHIAERSVTLESVSAFAGWRTVNIGASEGHPAARLYINAVPSDYLHLLGARPLRGRVFHATEGQTPLADPVVIISERLWRDRLGADGALIGRSLVLSDRAYTVVGILPEQFRDLNVFEPPDVWIPIGMAPVAYGAAALESWSGRMFNGVARLKPGVTADQAQQELNTIAASLAVERPASNGDAGFNLETLPEYFFKPLQRPTMALTAAAGLVLLVAGANVTILLLLRNRIRAREFAVRAALGARGWALAAPVAAEVTIIVGSGSALGLAGAGWICHRLAAGGHLGLPAFVTLSLDANVVAVLCGLSVAVALAVAVVPAIRIARERGQSVLGSSRSITGTRDRLRSVLVAGEAALAVILISGAVGFSAEFNRLRNGNIPFPIDHLMTGRVDLRSPRYVSPDARRAAARVIHEQLEASAATTQAALWGPSIPGRAHFYLEMSATPEATDVIREKDLVRAWRHHVSPGALPLIGIRLMRGRDIAPTDGAGAQRVVILNTAAAARLWPDVEPIGRQLWFRGTPDPFTVVGLAEDVRPTNALGGAMPHAVYLSYQQVPEPSLVLLARTADARGFVEAAEDAVGATDGSLPVYDTMSLRARVDEENTSVRFGAGVMSAYAIVALLLAGAGVYSVLSFLATARAREVALRLALGASFGNVRRGLFLAGVRPVFAGIVAGLVLSLISSRTGEAMGLAYLAPLSAVALAVTLVAVMGTIAAVIPAVRSTRRSPSLALKE